MKHLTLLCLMAALSAAATPGQVEIFSAGEIQSMGAALTPKGGAGFASRNLPRYGNHYLMLAKREKTGSSEVHEHEADLFIIEEGKGTLLSGGQMTHPHTEKPGEIRGTGIEGGERHPVSAGDIIHIPAGTPHQLLLDSGGPFTYFVIKVTGQ